jgi:hypothetical protein
MGADAAGDAATPGVAAVPAGAAAGTAAAAAAASVTTAGGACKLTDGCSCSCSGWMPAWPVRIASYKYQIQACDDGSSNMYSNAFTQHQLEGDGPNGSCCCCFQFAGPWRQWWLHSSCLAHLLSHTLGSAFLLYIHSNSCSSLSCAPPRPVLNHTAIMTWQHSISLPPAVLGGSSGCSPTRSSICCRGGCRTAAHSC